MENQSDGRLLIRIDEKVSNILRRMDGYDASILNLDTRIDRVEARVESRIGKLENWRWFILGAASILSFVFSIAIKVFL